MRAGAATSSSRPRRARRRGSPSAGCPATRRWLELQLKLLADVGLVGLPNAGKSSLLAALTRARPKIADYPFTTLEPVLGTVELDERQLVIADIPGLIEGASEGSGLGHDFLAHVERTRLLVHVLDLAPVDGSDPVANHETIERELELHDPRLAALPRVLVLSKADLVPEAEAEAEAEAWRQRLPGVTVLLTSSATGRGLDELVGTLMREVPVDAPVPESVPLEEALAEHRVFRPAAGKGFDVERVDDGVFRVTGERVARLMARHDLGNDEALAYVEGRLQSMGVIRALEAAGFEPGDDVEIAGVVFELDPDTA